MKEIKNHINSAHETLVEPELCAGPILVYSQVALLYIGSVFKLALFLYIIMQYVNMEPKHKGQINDGWLVNFKEGWNRS